MRKHTQKTTDGAPARALTAALTLVFALTLLFALPTRSYAEGEQSRTPVLQPLSSGGAMDYAELYAVIETARAIEDDGYTTQSWQRFTEALAVAEERTKRAGSQRSLDSAAAGLREAIDGLSYPDYIRLQATLDAAEAFLAADELGGEWKELREVMAEGSALLDSRDQEEIDACTERLRALLEQLAESLDGLKIIYQEKVVEVTAAPATAAPTQPAPAPAAAEEPKSGAPRWLVPVLVASVVVNAALAVVFIYLPRRAKDQIDDTPVVNYSIEDDE